jgi:hypothetical protein
MSSNKLEDPAFCAPTMKIVGKEPCVFNRRAWCCDDVKFRATLLLPWTSLPTVAATKSHHHIENVWKAECSAKILIQ